MKLEITAARKMDQERYPRFSQSHPLNPSISGARDLIRSYKNPNVEIINRNEGALLIFIETPLPDLRSYEKLYNANSLNAP